MKGKITLNLLLALGLILALGAGSSLAQEAAPSGPAGIDAALGTAFTYQGRLLKDGNPVAGPCDFEFSLWSHGLTGSQIGTKQTKNNIALSNGHFTVALDFGPTAFPGDARFLEVSVRCPASTGTWTPLSGRVELTAAPYALGLRPNASVSGSIAPGYVLKVENTATGMIAGDGLHGVSANGIGLYGESLSSTGTGVKGKAASTGKGVHGETVSGYGVYGEATGTSGVIYGVYGKTSSTAGQAVYGEATATSGTTYGVYGKTNSPSGYGVYGKGASSGGAGVFGESSSGHGVHGKAAPPDGFGVYSEGNAHVEGNLSWKGKTGYVAVSAAAFRPVSNSYAYENWGNNLTPLNTSSHWYYAPVQLPHNATIAKMVFYWRDQIGGLVDAECKLYRNNMAGGGDQLANALSFGSSGNGSSETTTISYPVVDNLHYAYYLQWWLDGPSHSGYGVVIEYTFHEPY